MVTTVRRADRLILYNISWEQFENLLEDLGDHRAVRIAYDNGTLEIITPLLEHEYFKEVIGTAVQDIAEEVEMDYESHGSTTLRKQVNMARLQPDNCFYFQNEAIVRGRVDLHLRACKKISSRDVQRSIGPHPPTPSPKWRRGAQPNGEGEQQSCAHRIQLMFLKCRCFGYCT